MKKNCKIMSVCQTSSLSQEFLESVVYLHSEKDLL